LNGEIILSTKRLRNKTTAVGRSLRRRFYQSKVNQLYQ